MIQALGYGGGPNRGGDMFHAAAEQLRARQQISQTCGLKSVGLDFVKEEEAMREAESHDAMMQDQLNQQLAKLQLPMGQQVEEQGQDRVVANYYRLTDIEGPPVPLPELPVQAFGKDVVDPLRKPQRAVGWGERP